MENWGSNIAAIDDPVRSNVPENDAALGEGKSEPVLHGYVGLPNIISAMVSMDIQWRVPGIIQKQVEFILKPLLDIAR